MGIYSKVLAVGVSWQLLYIKAIYGDAWVWIAFSPVYKLVPAWVVGKRTLRDARRLVLQLQATTDGHMPFFTSDALPHYADALWEVYGVCDAPPRQGTCGNGVDLRLSVALWLQALQLREFCVDGAETPLTGHVRPPPHHARVPEATGGVLQIGEPSMDGLWHAGPPSPPAWRVVASLSKGARSQGSNPWQTQVMALGVPLPEHFPLDLVFYLRYKTFSSLTLLSADWRRHGIVV